MVFGPLKINDQSYSRILNIIEIQSFVPCPNISVKSIITSWVLWQKNGLIEPSCPYRDWIWEHNGHRTVKSSIISNVQLFFIYIGFAEGKMKTRTGEIKKDRLKMWHIHTGYLKSWNLIIVQSSTIDRPLNFEGSCQICAQWTHMETTHLLNWQKVMSNYIIYGLIQRSGSSLIFV